MSARPGRRTGTRIGKVLTASRHWVQKAPSAIPGIQAAAKCSIVALARRAAAERMTLKALAIRLVIPHSTLKAALARRGYRLPVGSALLDCHLLAISGIGLADTLREMAASGLSRGAIARDLCVEPTTLQAVADRCGITFPRTMTIRDPSNIVAAMKARIASRNDLRVLKAGGEAMHLADWARKTCIPESTIRARLAHGWSVEDALTPSPRGTVRRGSSRMKVAADTHPWRRAEQQHDVLASEHQELQQTRNGLDSMRQRRMYSRRKSPT